MLANTITDHLITKGILPSSSRTVFIFSLSVFFHNFLIALLCLTFGLLTHTIFETIIFLILFPQSHHYLQGLHAQTKSGCTLASICLYLTALWLCYTLPSSIIIILPTYCIILMIGYIFPKQHIHVISSRRHDLTAFLHCFILSFFVASCGVLLVGSSAWRMCIIAILLSGGDFLICANTQGYPSS